MPSRDKRLCIWMAAAVAAVIAGSASGQWSGKVEPPPAATSPRVATSSPRDTSASPRDTSDSPRAPAAPTSTSAADTRPVAPPSPVYLGVSTLSGKQVTDEAVTKALERGVEKLLAMRNKDGIWEIGWGKDDRHYGGPTCLALYALLHVGQSMDDKRLKSRSEELGRAVKFATDLQPNGTYVASLQASVLSLLPRKQEHSAKLVRLRDLLINSVQKDGGYGYNVGRIGENSDNSNSQYGLLGIWAAYDADVTIPGKYFHDVEKFWRARYRPAGGWAYTGEGEPTINMTAAGVASLYITTEHTDTTVRLESKPDAQLDAAMAFLAKQYKPSTMAGYGLYGVERVGLASGRKFFGEANWFVEGAADLIARQQQDGSWVLGDMSEASTLVSTSFALLFLARGRNPVVFNKLEYEGNTWDARPRDVMNVTAWMSRQFERPINWQVVSFAVSPEQWRDAPVLLITGSKDPALTPEQVAKLRKFAAEGGLILSSADGESAEFGEAMKRYAEEITDKKYPWRQLPADHPLFSVYQKMKDPPALFGVSNGVREWWIHSPADLGAAWHKREHATETEKKKGNLAKERPWDLAANVYFYANGRGQMLSKLQVSIVPESGTRPTRTLKAGRLKYGGNWDPEPGAFDRISRVAYNRWRLSLEFEPVTFDTLGTVRVVTMTGLDKFEFSAEEKAKLKKFCDSGGVLVADALNSSKEFDRSFQALVRELYAGERWQLLDNRSSLFIGNLEGTAPLTQTHLRMTTQEEYGNLLSPRIYALLTKEGKLRVLYSPLDVTVAFLGTTTTGMSGYTTESAEKIARNMYVYLQALTGGK